MGESIGSVSIDVDLMQLGGKEHMVKTSKGLVSVRVCGDEKKPALVTYPDVALNYESCFQGLFFCPDAAPLLLHNFCVYHIDALGHELGADVIVSDVPNLSVDYLADQVAEVIDHFGYEERVLGLILDKAPSWTKWLKNKLLGERQGLNVMRFLDAMNRRHDLTEGLDKLQCKTLIFVGENSPFYGKSVYISTKMDRKACALVEVQGCGDFGHRGTSLCDVNSNRTLLDGTWLLQHIGHAHGTRMGPIIVLARRAIV